VDRLLACGGDPLARSGDLGARYVSGGRRVAKYRSVVDVVAACIAAPGDTPPVAFRRWLAESVIADGRSVYTLALAAGLGRGAVYEMLTGRREMPSEARVRTLAQLFGHDADDVAGIAGYHRAGGAATPPANYATFGAWLTAACLATGKSRWTVSLEAGLAVGTVGQLASARHLPRRSTLSLLARYFGVGERDLLALVTGPDARTGRAEDVAVTGGRRGAWLPCVVCGDPERLLYRGPAALARQQTRCHQPGEVSSAAPINVFHAACYREWRRSPAMRQQARLYGTIGQARRRVLASGDAGLIAEFDERVRAQLAYLRRPNRRGRPPTLLRDIALGRQVLRLRDEQRLRALDASREVGFPTGGDAFGKPAASRGLWRSSRIGRAIVGRPTLPPGRPRGQSGPSSPAG
jgi:hypothetical protein